MPVEKFIDDVTVPSITAAGLAASTTTLYTTAMTRARTELRGLPLADAATYGELEAALQHIAERYGLGAAKNAKKALNGHFIAPLLRHGVIDRNPLQATIDLVSMAKEATESPRGSADLTDAHRRAVVAHLLAIDPTDGVPVKSKSRWSYAHRLAVRRNAIDQCLLQAATGLRLQEAVNQRWSDITGDGILTTTFPKPVRVGGESVRKPRTIPILLPEVAAHLRDRAGHAAGEYAIPHPADADRPWGLAAAKEGMAALYVELAETLKIDPLLTLRSHAWRTVINRAFIAAGVPAAQRVAYLGHTEGVNAASYTHGVSLTAIQALIPSDPKTTV
ncbi:hypothetical protein AXK61_20945 [Tsukamurella pseudospumae]|uniref:Tyr recombinase domain-containing protein n=2 Tax=Tsukamurella pseudospumae TaxID=239498 RepID=A0A137ZI58_9ACTN|nr:hypothetical protein AXK61_20945 [Tsukamurella pseudospumae]